MYFLPMKKLLIILPIIFFIFSVSNVKSENNFPCIDEEILTETEKSPDYNLLSFPAVSTDDPYFLAVSYFNSKMNLIVKENYVSQYEYLGVPFPIYKSFLYSADKKDYFEKCIKDRYDALKVY